MLCKSPRPFGALMFPAEHHAVGSKSWLGGHLLQRLHNVLGQGESSLVNRRIIVASLQFCSLEALCQRAQGHLTMCRVVTAPGKGHDTPDIGRYRCAIEGGIGKDGSQTLVGVTHLPELHVADAVLGGQDSSRLEAAMTVGI